MFSFIKDLADSATSTATTALKAVKGLSYATAESSVGLIHIAGAFASECAKESGRTLEEIKAEIDQL